MMIDDDKNDDDDDNGDDRHVNDCCSVFFNCSHSLIFLKTI